MQRLYYLAKPLIPPLLLIHTGGLIVGDVAPFHPCGEQILRVARVAIRLINRLEKAEIETIGQLAQQASTSRTGFLPLLSLANVS